MKVNLILYNFQWEICSCSWFFQKNNNTDSFSAFGNMPAMAGSPDAPDCAKYYRLARVSKCFEKWRTSILGRFFKAQLKWWKNNAKGLGTV